MLSRKKEKIQLNNSNSLNTASIYSRLHLLIAGYHVCCSQHIAKLSTMTQDAMVYKVSSCFFFMVSFFFLIVAQLKLGPTLFTEDPRTYNFM